MCCYCFVLLLEREREKSEEVVEVSLISFLWLREEAGTGVIC